ncbi:serine/arginine repetitive matrix protein 1-like [Chenopodium quinoa]|uniref:serine/arginine repetitive matrix protein 1-like n=1 Tax=Chenopodium quinoa TaxID=63459 RepID=UPI000B796986|nr:serine/arginine repetitive matrix protein 1-like [Chenopodium quinoa]
MGCCVSTHDKQNRLKHSSLQPNDLNEFPCVSKSPPIAEEEAVKEVLSETPKPRPKPRSRPESPRKVVAEHGQQEESMKSKVLPFTPPKKAYPEEQKLPTGYPDPCTPEEISEASEMCSFSESISTTREDDHHLNQILFGREGVVTSGGGGGSEYRQRVYRSQGFNNVNNGGGGGGQHYRNQGRSPARRRPEPSPPRKRNPSPGGGVPKREFTGDNSGRRSQSPGIRANVGRSPSSRRTGPSPGRVRMVHGPENGRKVEEEMEENEEIGMRRESEEWQGPKESLENPLVSLECFIFL